jgi:hypothetical protein
VYRARALCTATSSAFQLVSLLFSLNASRLRVNARFAVGRHPCKSDLATNPVRPIEGLVSAEFCYWLGSLLRGVFPHLMRGFASLSDTTTSCIQPVAFRRRMAPRSALGRRSMQDTACQLPGIYIPRTPLNKGERMRCGEHTGRDAGSVRIMGTTGCRQAGGRM